MRTFKVVSIKDGQVTLNSIHGNFYANVSELPGVQLHDVVESSDDMHSFKIVEAAPISDPVTDEIFELRADLAKLAARVLVLETFIKVPANFQFGGGFSRQ